MLTKKHLTFIFLPALLLVTLALFIQIVRYEPLFPKETPEEETAALEIPVFPDDIVIGNKKAPTVVIAFEDFSCPACETHDAALTELMATYPGTFRVIWKGLPVARFPYSSEPAERYGYCAHAQGKFAEFKTAAFSNRDNLSESILKTMATSIGLNETALATCVASPEAKQYITKVEQVATMLNIQSVPAFFIRNQQIDPAPNVESWKAILNLR